jgi:hypothetical protein
VAKKNFVKAFNSWCNCFKTCLFVIVALVDKARVFLPSLIYDIMTTAYHAIHFAMSTFIGRLPAVLTNKKLS